MRSKIWPWKEPQNQPTVVLHFHPSLPAREVMGALITNFQFTYLHVTFTVLHLLAFLNQHQVSEDKVVGKCSDACTLIFQCISGENIIFLGANLGQPPYLEGGHHAGIWICFVPCSSPPDAESMLQLVLPSGTDIATGSWLRLQVVGKHRQHCGQPGIREFKMQHDILKLLQAFTCEVQGSPQVPPAADSPSPICPPLLSPFLVVAKPQCRARGKKSALPPHLAQLMALDQSGRTCLSHARTSWGMEGSAKPPARKGISAPVRVCVCVHANHSWPVNHCQRSQILGHSSGTNQ